MVIEVAWSQTSLDLPKLATTDIQDGKCRIRTVVGVDLDYQRSTAETDPAPGTSARFLIWRAGLPNQRGAP